MTMKLSISWKSKPSVGSWVFTILKVSAFITLICFIIVSRVTYSKDGIDCIGQSVPATILNSYCLTEKHYSMRQNSPRDDATIHRGLSAHFGYVPTETVTNNTFAWLPLYLGIQFFMCLIPVILWKSFENGYYEQLLQGLNHAITDMAEVSERVSKSVSFFSNRASKHMRYAVGYYVCEVVGFFMAIGVFFTTNLHTDGQFFRFIPNVFRTYNTTAEIGNLLDEVFPKIVKCTFEKFGPSGVIQRYDSLCVLTLNYVNEKVFAILWVTYVALMVIIAVVLVMDLLLLLISGLRNELLLLGVYNNETETNLRPYLRKSNFGDWLLVKSLSKDMKHFREWTEALSLQEGEKATLAYGVQRESVWKTLRSSPSSYEV